MCRPLHLAIAIAVIAAPGFTLAQQPATPQQQQQQNAASASKDTSGATGDQITKPAGAKGATLIGCLEGPDNQGKYTLRSMQHRAGVEVLGPDDLKNDSGSKVKLTGEWQPSKAATAAESAPPQSSQSNSSEAKKTASPEEKTAEMRRFQVTDIEVMARTCTPPSETTPVNKNKKQKSTTYNATSESGK